MKKISQIIFVGFLLLGAGCKKNYTCSCTYSTVETTPVSVNETSGETATSYNKVTKKYAMENCKSGKDYSTTGTGTNTITRDYVYNCSLNGTPK